jgi:hypothetical protein
MEVQFVTSSSGRNYVGEAIEDLSPYDAKK